MSTIPGYLTRAVRDWVPEAAGLAYQSRLDDAEWCWALWDDTAVEVRIAPLDVGHRHVRRSVQSAAHLLGITLPAPWDN